MTVPMIPNGPEELTAAWFTEAIGEGTVGYVLS